MRIVFDTNVIVSFFLSPSGTPAQLLDLWEHHTELFEVVVSETILIEYARALSYPHVTAHHKKSPEQIDAFINLFRKLATIVEPTETVTVIKDDPDDNKFLSCALSGHAEYIISGDRDLLRIGEYKGIHILTPKNFLTLLG